MVPTAKAKSSNLLRRLFRKKAARRRALTAAVVVGNLLILATVVGVIALAPRDSVSSTPTLNAATSGQVVANPLDHVSSANIAQTVAQMSNLAESTAVTNQADSQASEIAAPATTATVVDKPQVLSTAGFASNKDIKTYTVANGETITSIATKFGITSDSIRWSNNVSGDAVTAGTKLLIPPVTGMVYRVAAGDNAATLAAKFKADQNKIIAYNDAEITGLQIGSLILIPDGSKAAAVASTTRSGGKWTGSATYGGYNGYDYGYCTYWVAKLRANAGNPVPTNLGNAATWATRAAAMGLPTGTTPRIGAAVVTKTAGAGHVAYVTGYDAAAGTITISEMNHSGWNKVNSRTLPAASNFRYIY